jgi:hypothetical protein
VLRAPPRGHWLGGEVLRGLRPVALDVSTHRAEVRSEIRQYLMQAGLRGVRAVERSEAVASVVEAVIELVELPRVSWLRQFRVVSFSLSSHSGGDDLIDTDRARMPSVTAGCQISC